MFLGATAYGGARPDVAAVHGDQFKESGFGLVAQGLCPADDYDLAAVRLEHRTGRLCAGEGRAGDRTPVETYTRGV